MRFFLTTVLSEHLIAKYKLSFAACNFSFNLMSGGGFDKTYSILPLFTSGKIEEDAFKDSRYELVYSKTFRKRDGKWTLLACIAEQWRLFRKIPQGSIVWTYNLNTLLALTVLLLKIFKPSVQINVIVLDFTPVVKGVGLNQFYLKLINTVHGNICLANSTLFTCKNRIVLPGVVPVSAGGEPIIKTYNKKFLLSGVLNESIAQVTMVLKAFSELTHCELHITGSGESEELIELYASQFQNIIFHGKVSFKDYLDIMHECTYQLSTRDVSYPENQCNFPSKIIEGLLHNRIVISTIEYEQLDGVKYFVVDSDYDIFKKQITAIVNTVEPILMQYSNQGKKVTELFNTQKWNESMRKIEQL